MQDFHILDFEKKTGLGDGVKKLKPSAKTPR
jgi:hypothetical protein